MGLLGRGTEPWYAAVAIAVASCARLGDFADVVAIVESLPPLDRAADTAPAQITTLARAVPELLQIGRADLADRVLAPLAEVRADPQSVGLDVIGWIENALAWKALFDGDTGESLKYDEAAARSFERAGDARNACRHRLGAGYEQVLLGAFPEAEATLREALAAAQRMGLDALAINARHNLGPVLARRGAFPEAIALETEALAAYKERGDTKLIGASEHYLAIILMLAGDVDGAEKAANRCLEALSSFPPLKPRGLATSAKILLLQGRAAEARERATEAIRLLEAQGGIEDGEALIRLVYAESLHATGAHEEARAAIASARARLASLAEKIRDPALHASFLERVPENAETLRLAQVWGV
jgi:tetratricopeptide (TPR) repeat protein